MKRFLVAITLALGVSSVVVGYKPQSAERLSDAAETTPAYGVLVLRKATVESELVDLSGRLTSQHPSVQSKEFELHAIRFEMNKMRALEKSQVSKLSTTLGNLILSKVALEVELNDLLVRLTSEHPDVKKKRIELAVIEREITNVLR
jgi:uncharacterized protein involved in exopolysaccharide biosynthesis